MTCEKCRFGITLDDLVAIPYRDAAVAVCLRCFTREMGHAQSPDQRRRVARAWEPVLADYTTDLNGRAVPAIDQL